MPSPCSVHPRLLMQRPCSVTAVLRPACPGWFPHPRSHAVEKAGNKPLDTGSLCAMITLPLGDGKGACEPADEITSQHSGSRHGKNGYPRRRARRRGCRPPIHRARLRHRRRAASGRPADGRRGHAGHGRHLLPGEHVAHIVEVKPEARTQCGTPLAGEDPDPGRHQLWHDRSKRSAAGGRERARIVWTLATRSHGVKKRAPYQRCGCGPKSAL